MSYDSHMPKLAVLSREETGIFTAARPVRLEVPRDAISYALRTGRLESDARGAYRLTGMMPTELDLAVASRKLTAPSTLTRERISTADGIVVGGRTATHTWGISAPRDRPHRISLATLQPLCPKLRRDSACDTTRTNMLMCARARVHAFRQSDTELSMILVVANSKHSPMGPP